MSDWRSEWIFDRTYQKEVLVHGDGAEQEVAELSDHPDNGRDGDGGPPSNLKVRVDGRWSHILTHFHPL